MFHKSAGNQNGMNRNISPGMAVFELCTRIAKICDGQVIAQIFGLLNVAHLKLGKLFQACTGKECQQWQPVTGNFAATQGEITLGVNGRAENQFQISQRKPNAGFMGAFIREFEMLYWVFINELMVYGRVKYGF